MHGVEAQHRAAQAHLVPLHVQRPVQPIDRGRVEQQAVFVALPVQPFFRPRKIEVLRFDESFAGEPHLPPHHSHPIERRVRRDRRVRSRGERTRVATKTAMFVVRQHEGELAARQLRPLRQAEVRFRGCQVAAGDVVAQVRLLDFARENVIRTLAYGVHDVRVLQVHHVRLNRCLPELRERFVRTRERTRAVHWINMRNAAAAFEGYRRFIRAEYEHHVAERCHDVPRLPALQAWFRFVMRGEMAHAVLARTATVAKDVRIRDFDNVALRRFDLEKRYGVVRPVEGDHDIRIAGSRRSELRLTREQGLDIDRRCSIGRIFAGSQSLRHIAHGRTIGSRTHISRLHNRDGFDLSLLQRRCQSRLKKLPAGRILQQFPSVKYGQHRRIVPLAVVIIGSVPVVGVCSRAVAFDANALAEIHHRSGDIPACRFAGLPRFAGVHTLNLTARKMDIGFSPQARTLIGAETVGGSVPEHHHGDGVVSLAQVRGKIERVVKTPLGQEASAGASPDVHAVAVDGEFIPGCDAKLRTAGCFIERKHFAEHAILRAIRGSPGNTFGGGRPDKSALPVTRITARSVMAILIYRQKRTIRIFCIHVKSSLQR